MLRSLVAAFLIAGKTATVHAAAQEPIKPVATIGFELHRNKILVPVRLNGRGPFSFILDTGSPVTLLGSSSLARSLALRSVRRVDMGGAGDGARLQAAVSQPIDISLGDVSLGMEPLVVADIAEQLAASSGRYYHGILGADLFKRYIVKVDYERRALELYEPADYTAPYGANALPLRMQNGHPHIDTRITLENGDEVDVDLVIDTGARTALMLDGDRRSPLAPPRGAVEMIIGHGARGPVSGRVSHVTSLTLGDTQLSDVLAAFVDDVVGTSPGADGNVGNEVLRRFAVTIDYPGERLVLEPTQSLEDEYAVDLSGITLRAGGTDWSDLSVADVRTGSLAFNAGVIAGDAIVAIDGRAPSSLATLERLLQQPGTVELQLNRGGNTLTVQLELGERVAGGSTSPGL